VKAKSDMLQSILTEHVQVNHNLVAVTVHKYSHFSHNKYTVKLS